MDIAQRINDIRALLVPMVQRGLITPAQEENCERMLVNLAESVDGDPTSGMHHHQYCSHRVLIDAIFNGCSQNARDYAMGLNLERVTFDLELSAVRPDDNGNVA